MALAASRERVAVARLVTPPRDEPPAPRLVPPVRDERPGPAPAGVAPWSDAPPATSPAGDLSARLQSLYDTQVHERSRIARELHDVVGQALTAVRLSLMFAREAPDPAQIEMRIDAALEIIDSALVDVRAIAYDLRPTELDDLGLLAAVRWCLARHENASGLHMILRPSPGVGADPGVETAAYRIIQEAVTNVVRHAAARRVVVGLRQRGSELRVDIADDGVGFAVGRTLAARRSIGLVGMYERAELAGGQLEIRSAAGRGTRVSARFPGRTLA
jgi:signal transduction histidine kinase